jgi:hypothetical protein
MRASKDREQGAGIRDQVPEILQFPKSENLFDNPRV